MSRSAPDRRPKCGTVAGAQAHRRHGEPVCERCRSASNQYLRKWRKTAKGRQSLKQQNTEDAIRTRAMRALAKRHRAEYQALITLERQRQQQKETA